MPGERHLAVTAEDAEPDIRAGGFGGKHERALAEIGLARHRRHRRDVETLRFEKHRELVAGERPIGEDVGT